MIASIIPPKLHLNPDKPEDFELWKQKWKIFATVSELATKSSDFQVNLFLSCLDDEALKAYNNLTLTTDEKKSVDLTIAALQKRVHGEVNETMERHLFNNRHQEEGEKFIDYLTTLQQMMKSCHYCAQCEENILRDRIVEGINNDETRRRLLGTKKLNLKTAIEICKLEESSERQMEIFRSKKEHQINRLIKQEKKFGAAGQSRAWEQPGHSQRDQAARAWEQPGHSQRDQAARAWEQPESHQRDQGGRPKTGSTEMTIECYFCLRTHKKGRNHCPAYGKNCHACSKFNHFEGSRFCARKKIEEMQNMEEKKVEVLHLGSIDSLSTSPAWKVTVGIQTSSGIRPLEFKIDCGADVTAIPPFALEQLGIPLKSLERATEKISGPDVEAKMLHCSFLNYDALEWEDGESPCLRGSGSSPTFAGATCVRKNEHCYQ